MVGRRVVVTGIGLVSPVGTGIEPFWTALVERRPGVRRITRFDASTHVCQVAGEIDDSLFTPLIHPRKLRTASRASQLGLAATSLALEQAGWDRPPYSPERVGTMIGTALGGWTDTEKQFAILLERGARRVNPFIANASPPHASGGEIATHVGARGPQLTFSNGCPASLLAIGHAVESIARGELDGAVAGGVETPLSPLVFAGMGRTHELSRRLDPAAEACRPFDLDHDGMVLSEGACILVLEAEELAKAGGRASRGTLLGIGSSCDAVGLFDLAPDGVAAGKAIHQACERAGIAPGGIDAICAHANGSPAFDRKEAVVIRHAFGSQADRLPVSSIKGVLGHPFGAAGAFQVAAALTMIDRQTVVPTANLVAPATDCALAHVIGSPLNVPLGHMLVTSYGYGGVNGALIVGHV